VLNRIREDYNTHLGYVFEQITEEILIEMQRKDKLPFCFTAIGKWWFKSTEIDLIALDEETSTATFLETKWSTIGKQDTQRILNDLKTKSQQFRWNRKKENYGIIAKKITEKQQLRDRGYIALDLTDFEQL
jgi:hypothetical protein